MDQTKRWHWIGLILLDCQGTEYTKIYHTSLSFKIVVFLVQIKVFKLSIDDLTTIFENILMHFNAIFENILMLHHTHGYRN